MSDLINKSTPNQNISNQSYKSSFGLHQTIKYFEQSLKRPHNYVRIAKQYLKFTIENDYSIDEISVRMFIGNKAAVYKTACNKFLKFARLNDIHKVYDDSSPNYKGNPTVLYFLSEIQLSENSKETYAKALQEFYDFLDSKKLPPIHSSVLQFIEKCKKNGLSPYTTNTYLAAIKRFVEFCILKRAELKISDEMVDKMRDVQYVKTLKLGGTTKTYSKESLTENEREKLIQCIDSPRDKAVIALMAYQGLRTVEVIRLSWEDIKEVRGKNFLAVKGKGREEKELIPLLEDCHKILIAYQITETRPSGSMFGLTDTSMIRKITNKWLKVANLKREKISAHSLRHTVAQLLLDKGVPKPMVRRFLRHKSEAVTNIYTAKQEDQAFLDYEF